MWSNEELLKKPIKDLVQQNYVFAAVLHYFGISFFQYEHKSLTEVCRKFRINPQQLIDEMEAWSASLDPSEDELYLRPIEVLVAYLKRKHYFFIRQELPFLADMVEGIREKGEYAQILDDLRIMFPLFVEDFIRHIHEEEKSLFQRIKLLLEIEEGAFELVDALQILDQASIQKMSESHEIHDDEMVGIRRLTKDYYLSADASMGVRVLFHELMNFEKELIQHARIEDRLLFPKAIELEKEALKKLKKLIQKN